MSAIMQTLSSTMHSIETESGLDAEIQRLSVVATVLEWESGRNHAISTALLDLEIALQNLGIIKERVRLERA